MSIFEQQAKSRGGNGESFEMPQAGAHRGVLVALIDLGTQLQRGYQGAADQDVHQLLLVWELIDAPMSGMKRNHTIGGVYRVSMHEKAKLRKMFEGWRGRSFADNESFDPASALGKACMVNVLHKKSQDGSDYARVDNISGLILPKGQLPPKPTLPVLLYEMGKGTSERKAYTGDMAKDFVFLDANAPDAEWIPFIFGKSLDHTLDASVEMGRTPLGNRVNREQARQEQKAQDAATTPEQEIPW